MNDQNRESLKSDLEKTRRTSERQRILKQLYQLEAESSSAA